MSKITNTTLLSTMELVEEINISTLSSNKKQKLLSYLDRARKLGAGSFTALYIHRNVQFMLGETTTEKDWCELDELLAR